MAKKKSLTGSEKNTFVKSVLDVFQNNPTSSFNYKQVAARLGIQDRASKDLIGMIIGQLFKNKELAVSKRGKYQINQESPRYEKEVKTDEVIKVKINKEEIRAQKIAQKLQEREAKEAAAKIKRDLKVIKVKPIIIWPKKEFMIKELAESQNIPYSFICNEFNRIRHQFVKVGELKSSKGKPSNIWKKK